MHPHKENPPEPYQIPVRVLLAKDCENLLVVGRCMSATHEAHGSTRVSGAAMAVGQAAGALAAKAALEGKCLRSKQGAVLSL